MARYSRLGLLVVMGVLAVTAASCARATDVQWRAADGRGSADAPRLPASFRFAVDANAVDVAPAVPVTVTVANGRFETVTLTNAAGEAIPGTFDSSRTSWANSGPLKFKDSYTLAVKGTGDDGRPLEETRTFSTATPSNYTLPYLRANPAMLLDGGEFGVGQPVVVWFDEKIIDKASAERALTVTTTPATVGAFRWLNDQEVHWRPAEYWTPGTKVTVSAKLYGVSLGNGLYGQEDRSATFTIGRSKIAVADAATKRMTIYLDGVQVTTINGNDVSAGIPVSLGKNGGERAPNGTWIDFRTQSGPHVVLGKQEVVRMTSASYGLTDPTSPNYYDQMVRKAVHISGDGEYVHLADWNIPQHGVENTSHGCINVAPAYIYWFYDTFGPGDIVDVKNTGRDLPLGNGISDWVLPFEEWKQGSAAN